MAGVSQMVGEVEQEVACVRQTHMSFEWSDGTGESDFNELLGKLVRITGLTGRPELNGRLGAYAYIAYTTSTFASTQCVHKSSACIVLYRRSSMLAVACGGSPCSWHG